MLFKGTHVKNPSKASIVLILIGFVTIGLAFYFFMSLAEDVAEQEKFAIDRMVTEFIASFSTPALKNIMGYITYTGSVPWLIGGTVLLLAYLFFISSKSNWVSIFLLVNMLGISALTKGLKLLFERQRPAVLAQYDGTGYSFPSGHSTGAITFYGFLIYLISISKLDKKWKWMSSILLGIWISLVAFSRIFVGVHYFTDTLAGLSLGLAWLFICIGGLELMLLRNRRFKKKHENQTA